MSEEITGQPRHNALPGWTDGVTTDVPILAAQHTYTAVCDGLHEPGPCPVKPPVQTLIVGPDGFAVQDSA